MLGVMAVSLAAVGASYFISGRGIAGQASIKVLGASANAAYVDTSSLQVSCNSSRENFQISGLENNVTYSELSLSEARGILREVHSEVVTELLLQNCLRN